MPLETWQSDDFLIVFKSNGKISIREILLDRSSFSLSSQPFRSSIGLHYECKYARCESHLSFGVSFHHITRLLANWTHRFTQLRAISRLLISQETGESRIFCSLIRSHVASTAHILSISVQLLSGMRKTRTRKTKLMLSCINNIQEITSSRFISSGAEKVLPHIENCTENSNGWCIMVWPHMRPLAWERESWRICKQKNGVHHASRS